MKLNNIISLIKNDAVVIKRVKWRLLEITYFPLTSVLIWGLFSLQSKQYAIQAGLIVLVVNMFWSFCQLAQQQANILIMEDLWSFNIKHILVSGVSEFEYIIAKLVTSTTIAIVIGTMLLIVANAFGAPLLANIKIVAMLAGIALLGSLALSIVIAGTILLVGREYGFLSWSILQLFIFFSAPFYSPTLFPEAIRWITKIMPFTHIFEAARAIATNAPVANSTLWHALFITTTYFCLAWPYYAWAIRHAKKSGMMSRIAH
ncbi:MAG: ABC transporter permease [Candidatus Woesearchaeota archaeon]|nr:ABC transporter permease [Candidatus Woesearchaeota archaeon]